MSKYTDASDRGRPAVVDRAEFDPQLLEPHRRELTGYCYRLLGSFAEAEDAVQETMIRAWKGWDGFEGRSSARTWLHRVATNVCLDMLRGRKRRALPMGLVPPTVVAQMTDIGPQLAESTWVLPAPDGRVLPDHADPAQVVAQRETVRLAFLAALQQLPPRQRAVLVLREVLDWSAAEVAQLLGGSVASVNSALQRARATLAARDPATRPRPVAAAADNDGRSDLLAQFVDAFERYDVQRLTSLLHDDVVQAMPPYRLWLRGAAQIGAWMLGPGAECRGSRLLPAGGANAASAFGQYHSDGRGGHEPFALHLVSVEGDRIAEIHTFLMPQRLFPQFGLPLELSSATGAAFPGDR